MCEFEEERIEGTWGERKPASARQIELEALAHTLSTSHKTMFQNTWWECRSCPAGREV